MRYVICVLLFTVVTLEANAQAPAVQRFEALLARATSLQDDGADVSLPATLLEDARGLIRQGFGDLASAKMDDVDAILDTLRARPVNMAPTAQLTVDAAFRGAPIPHLAGNIVNKNLHDEVLFQRFMREIGPGLIQMKLFIADLNEARDNYCYNQRPGRWEETFRQIKAAGGEILLHLRQVPARLTLVPEANRELGDGRAPVSDLNEWSAIVEEVVRHFNSDPSTRIRYLQDIGEPNIGTNWYDPANLDNSRPLNADTFAEHFIATWQGAKAADPAIQVGGPTIWLGKNDTAWWDGFLGTLRTAGVPMDYATIHIYDPNFAIWDYGVAETQRQLAAHGLAGLPINMTEWNLAGTIALPEGLQASHFNASHALVGFLRLLASGVQHTYFQLNPQGDAVCVELPPIRGTLPGNHLFLLDGETPVPNTSYNAFRLFAKLRDAERLPLTSTDHRVQGIAGYGNDTVSLMLTYYEPTTLTLTPDSIAHTVPDFNRTRRVDVRLDNLPFERYTLDVYRIDEAHSNVHTLGAAGAELSVATSREGTGRTFETTLDLPIYGVYMLQLRAQTSTAAEEATPGPTFALAPSYPNPFRDVTQLTYTLAQPETVTLRVYDVVGRAVATLVDAPQAVGTHTLAFDGSALPNGIYYAVLQTPTQRTQRSLTVAR